MRKLRSAWIEFNLQVRILWESAKAFLKFITIGAIDCITPVGRLYVTIIHKDGTRDKLGLVCTKVVTTAGVNYIVDALQANSTDSAAFNDHASGTGTTAEAIGNTTLVTQSGSRVSGTQVEGASANIYRTVATMPYTAALAITEHGVFSATTGGTLLDRSVFAAINVINGDSIEFTYELTLPAGS